MMFNSHIRDQLTAYLDDEMRPGARERADAHLARCGSCREELQQVRGVATMLQDLPLAKAPDGLWAVIEAAAGAPRKQAMPVWRYAAAAAVILVIASAVLWPRSTWEVTIAGTTEIVRNGRWIDTGNSSARIKVADIGSVDVEPNTRVRLVSTGAAGHRLALASGAIMAKIAAPPRLFFVDTPAGTAIDLGCEYRIHCDRAGDGLLRVSAGWVAFEWQGRESLVPAGASCRMRPGRGPGTPWFGDAPARLVEALDRFDSGEDGLTVIVTEARARDTLTLWHLISRVSAGERARVYERMVELAPPPSGVTREQILSLDSESLTRWKNELAWIW
jgi:hypothetical protein